MQTAIVSDVKCAICGDDMRIFRGQVRPGMYNTSVLNELWDRKLVNGALKCPHCSRYFCWNCSNLNNPCSCGQKKWQEVVYFENNPGVTNELARLGFEYVTERTGSENASERSQKDILIKSGIIILIVLTIWALVRLL